MKSIYFFYLLYCLFVVVVVPGGQGQIPWVQLLRAGHVIRGKSSGWAFISYIIPHDVALYMKVVYRLDDGRSWASLCLLNTIGSVGIGKRTSTVQLVTGDSSESKPLEVDLPLILNS